MNILLIPDKFKGSLSSKEVIDAMARGIFQNNKDHHVRSVLASDGGEGFLDAVLHAKPYLVKVRTKVEDAAGNLIIAESLLDKNAKTAYLELAKTSGLSILKPKDRDCKLTSTYGTGLQLKNAMEKGAKKIYIGLGGSATNDGGTGLARALGVRFLDKNANEIVLNGMNLHKIRSIIPSDLLSDNKIEIHAVADVINPLLGPTGATYTYALQKGASSSDLPELEKGMQNLFDIASQKGTLFSDTPGFGAAGGTGFGLFSFAGAKMVLGIDFILDLNRFETILKDGNTDLILTGEGKIDDQTFYGKFVKGIGERAKKYKVPVVAICGSNDLNRYSPKDLGIDKIYTVRSKNMSLEQSMENAGKLIEELINRVLQNN